MHRAQDRRRGPGDDESEEAGSRRPISGRPAGSHGTATLPPSIRGRTDPLMRGGRRCSAIEKRWALAPRPRINGSRDPSRHARGRQRSELAETASGAASIQVSRRLPASEAGRIVAEETVYVVLPDRRGEGRSARASRVQRAPCAASWKLDCLARPSTCQQLGRAARQVAELRVGSRDWRRTLARRHPGQRRTAGKGCCFSRVG
jgi:hypothetical protein